MWRRGLSRSFEAMHPMIVENIANQMVEDRLRTAAVVRVRRLPRRRRVWRTRPARPASRSRIAPARR